MMKDDGVKTGFDKQRGSRNNIVGQRKADEPSMQVEEMSAGGGSSSLLAPPAFAGAASAASTVNTISAHTVGMPSIPAVQRGPREHFQLSPELAAKKARIEEFWTRPLTATASALPTPPPLPQGQGADDPPAWAAAMMQAITDLSGSVSEIKGGMVTMSVLKEYHEAATADTNARIVASAQESDRKIQELTERIHALELSRNSSSVSASTSSKDYSSDPAFCRLAVLGIPDSIDQDARLDAIDRFFQQNFPKSRVVKIENFHKGPRSARVLSNNAFVEFGTSDTARTVMAQIKDKGLQIKFGQTAVVIKPALTKNAIDRNEVLRQAEKSIKSSPALPQDASVKIEWKDDRGVKVNGDYAFKQDKKDVGGVFVGPYRGLPVFAP